MLTITIKKQAFIFQEKQGTLLKVKPCECRMQEEETLNIRVFSRDTVKNNTEMLEDR